MRLTRRRLQDICIVDDDRCGDLYCETCSNRLPRMYHDKRERRWKGYFPKPPKPVSTGGHLQLPWRRRRA